MKTKQFHKKLELNKKTIANLADDAMRTAKGGSPVGGNTTRCASWDTNCNTDEWISCEDSAIYCTYNECTLAC